MFRSVACLALFSILTLFVVQPGYGQIDGKKIQTEVEQQIQEVLGMDLEDLIEALDDTWEQYNRQLQAVLKTRRVEEQEFVARVVLLVQQEDIPKNLVDSAWLWVRSKRAGTRYPFIYFERVLRLQGEKVGVAIPPFNRNVYNSTSWKQQRIEQAQVPEQKKRLFRR